MISESLRKEDRYHTDRFYREIRLGNSVEARKLAADTIRRYNAAAIDKLEYAIGAERDADSRTTMHPGPAHERHCKLRAASFRQSAQEYVELRIEWEHTAVREIENDAVPA